MRRGLLLGAALGVVNAGVVLLVAWALRPPREFGWFSYTPMPARMPRRYADYLPATVDHRWHTVALLAIVLVVLDALLGAAYVRFLSGRGGNGAARAS